jgi:hypothetical protein
VHRLAREVAALMLMLCAWSGAQAEEVRIGRYQLVLPQDASATTREVDAGRTGGDNTGLPIQGSLLRLASGSGAPVALLVLKTVRGAGTFQWSGSCRNVKAGDRTFVHSPFHRMGDECLLVAGPYDLDGSMRAMLPEFGKSMDQAGWALKSAGFIVQASFAVETGEMLETIAFLPKPFDGLPVQAEQPENRSNVPDRVVAWGLALAGEVKAGVRSTTGRVRLPAIVKPAEGAVRTTMLSAGARTSP